MTVSELIEELKNLPQDLDVKVLDSYSSLVSINQAQVEHDAVVIE